MRYAIINFTRLGDLLQTQSTIAALKKNEENYVSLICLENFAKAAYFISELDNISIFSGANILKEIQRDWRLALQDLDLWVDEYYRKQPFDVVINLTPSMPCRILAHLLSRKNEHIRLEGFGIDHFGFGRNSSVWTSYIQAVTQERGCSPYNLIDGFRSMLSLPPEPFRLKIPNTALLETAELFLETEKQSICEQFPSIHVQDLSFVGFQLGASSEKRQWHTKNFAELGKMLWENKKIIPVLLGSTSERAIADTYIAHTEALDKSIPYIDLCGKTNLEELGSILCKLEALVSNDTGTLHLAIGLGIASLGIYLATAQVWDTGPYGEKHLCVEPRLDCHPCSFSSQCKYDFKCRQHVSSKSMYKALSMLLDIQKNDHNTDKKDKTDELKTKNNCIGDLRSENSSDIVWDDARIWQSYFDETGFVNYKSLSGDEKNDRSLWMSCQRVFYKNLLNAMNTNNISNINTGSLADWDIAESNYAQNYGSAPILHLKDNTMITDNIEFIQRLLSLILLAKEQASMLLIRPSAKLQEGFLSTIQRIESYFQHNSYFIPLLLLWKYLVQENANSLESLIHFFDSLHCELSHFKDYLTDSSL